MSRPGYSSAVRRPKISIKPDGKTRKKRGATVAKLNALGSRSSGVQMLANASGWKTPGKAIIHGVSRDSMLEFSGWLKLAERIKRQIFANRHKKGRRESCGSDTRAFSPQW